MWRTVDFRTLIFAGEDAGAGEIEEKRFVVGDGIFTSMALLIP